MCGHLVKCGLAAAALCGALTGGCAFRASGPPASLPGVESQALPPVGDGGAWAIWFWLALALAAALAAIFGLGREERRGALGPPLSREELALYRTAREALSFLIKKRLRALRVVSLEAFRLRRGA
ncbi:DNA repair protein RadC [Desulfarculus baarsii DSM 2075]|uniref:DNA repair protein RadC n=1 Tax=Desulfarculus baarsii (strain ATCC 33931 / DSM 2075 / LMG 7858 / VKM B-1802 / 2st14) TaxID=644282 RepID=E1QM42_DESB2|nr:DNA repair protein RadC [Desulfarculus baarsii DSM 2075]